eukprot:gene10735-11923_t
MSEFRADCPVHCRRELVRGWVPPPNGAGPRIGSHFRSVMNLGDYLDRRQCNSHSAGAMAEAAVARKPGRHTRPLSSLCVRSPEVPCAACNPRYVADSSEYTRYRRISAFAKGQTV